MNLMKKLEKEAIIDINPMTERVKELYKSGCKNKQFLLDIQEADGDSKPSIFAEDIEKVAFASIYYGWIVSKYGKYWKHFL